jgi:hypothetical protein
MGASLLLLLPACLLAAQTPAPGGTVEVVAYDAQGKRLDLEGLLRFIGRADGQSPPDPAKAAILAASPDRVPAPVKPRLRQEGSKILLSWEKLPRACFNLPWPVAEDGFSSVSIDGEGSGFSDGDVLHLNEQIAATQYRLLRDSLRKHLSDMQPLYKQDAKSRKKAEEAKNLMAAAHAEKDPAARARAFDKALRATSLAWQKVLIDHGAQIARGEKARDALRFGLTLDEGILGRLDHFRWIVAAIERSGTNWVRLVFRSNPEDFTYSNLRSFNDYDEIVAELRSRGLRVMGSVLDTAQWPRALTPQAYSERAKNLVLHYKDQIRSWEVGSEINGDWLGGRQDPLSLDQVYRIYSAAADKVKELDPALETVATLYWWEGTAPDEEHSTLGWLRRRSKEGFGRNLDVLGISLQPDDNPVGMALEPLFERVHQELPDKKLMISSLGYVEGDALKGYYWFDPQDPWSARSDLLTLLTPASCAMPNSLCGGFWWQTLEQMLPGNRKTTSLFKDHAKTLEQLGR